MSLPGPCATKSSTQSRNSLKTPEAIALFGPTAVGKTALTETLFSSGYEIVNADSIQIYRYLSIGSAKPDAALRERIPHHLIDIKDPWEEYSAGEFVSDVERVSEEIRGRGNMPLVTGGTAYYFKQLLYGKPDTPASDPAIRAETLEEIKEKGASWAWQYLGTFDPVSQRRISQRDVYRISRAIEIYRQTGRPVSSFAVPDRLRDDYLVIGLMRDKEELRANISKRVGMMFESGLYEEVKALRRMGANASWPGMEAIGYREFFKAMESGETSLSQIKDEIITNTRQYAKRQVTYFKTFGCRFFHPDDIEGIRNFLRSRC